MIKIFMNQKRRFLYRRLNFVSKKLNKNFDQLLLREED